MQIKESKFTRMIKEKLFICSVSLIICFGIISCSKEDDGLEDNQVLETPDWTIETHSSDVTPGFDIVFPSNQVNRIDIEIASEDWGTMQADLEDNLNKGQGPLAGDLDFDPVWVPCNVYFNNIEWYKVGIRFKGNSSLNSSYRAGIKKLPFKLDFDQFEDEWPTIKDQRFYGFKQLSLKNNFEDQSFIRESIASRLFSEFGLVSPHTSFYRLYIDYGEGEQYFGLYTLVEEVDDSVIKTQYNDDSGNLYKPEGSGASFASGTFLTSDMNKKNNESENDYSDVQSLYELINNAKRENDHESWKADLEKVFDVPIFLKWLAANTVMQNWDTYGVMTHNYYLYHNPASGKLEWIPWDGNEALKDGKMGGALSISLDEVSSDWPLIRYIVDDEEWLAQYKQELVDFTLTFFVPETMSEIYENNRELLYEYVAGELGEQEDYTFLNSSADFDNSINYLIQQVSDRNLVVQEYLSE